MCKQYLPGGSGSVGGINVGDPLDLFGGGKRRDAARLQQEAKDAEAARQGRITANVEGINSTFAGREGQYKQFSDALRQRYDQQLSLKRKDAERQSRFALARGGLTGGSAAIDAGKILSRESGEATLAAERATQKGVADLTAADEAARTNLISLAQTGNDIGNPAAQAGTLLRANLQNANAADTTDGLGNVFASTAMTYRAQQDAAARRRGLKEAQIYAKPFTTG